MSSLVLGAFLVGLIGAVETLAVAGVVGAATGVVFLVLLSRVRTAPHGGVATGT